MTIEKRDMIMRHLYGLRPDDRAPSFLDIRLATGLPQIRTIIRHMVRTGLAVYKNGGYRLTDEGRQKVEERK
jgi:Mn-dependent DtxR family transcriptional regulator